LSTETARTPIELDLPPQDRFNEAKHLLHQHLKRLGLKHSTPREIILRAFLETNVHLSTEELHHLVQKQDASIGYTTVYRSLKLFTECGLATAVTFHDGITRYESSLNRSHHHHMVCTGCGESVEFFAAEIEAIQNAIGEQFHYATNRHTFQIYGLCPKCQERQAN
jgi:Fur family ferric uptake transcriptional regulator